LYSIALALQEIKPDIIFHLAYDTEDLSGSIVKGTKDLLLARTATNVACRFIYLSTDAVFDGGSGPYREYDVPTPISAYGKAKRIAEIDVLKAHDIVVRTSLVYGFDPPDPRTVVLLQGLKSGVFKYKYFIDEIQNSPALTKLLRFFYEDRSEVHVIAAGSLLQAKIEREGLSVPVGRIEYAYLYPLDFFEYLEAKKETGLLHFLKSISLDESIPQGIHQEALKLFYEYTMVGGMPEIVKVFLEGENIEVLKNIYSSLLTGYAEDVYKYSSLANSKYLTFVIDSAPLYAGTNITYEKFGASNFRSREMKMSFDLLEKVMLLYQAMATKSIGLPLVPQRKRPKKLLFLDVGLINYQMGIQEKFLTLGDLNDFYRGRIAEQIVGQNILSQFMNYPAKFFYWAKQKPMGSAEVDFCLNKEGSILGIEVKSGSSKRLKSLLSFGNAIKSCQLLRIYSGELKKERIKTNNKTISLISLPFYLVPRILDKF